MNKIKTVIKKIDNKKDNLKSEYENFKLKLEAKKNDLSNEYEDFRKKYELKKEGLFNDYKKFKEKYEFKIEWKSIIWNKDRQKELKKDKKSVWDSIFSATVRELISFPFIWLMIIPAFFLDICLFIYQNTAIRLYKIPLAKRSDYITFDRGQLVYLNWIQKIDLIDGLKGMHNKWYDLLLLRRKKLFCFLPLQLMWKALSFL